MSIRKSNREKYISGTLRNYNKRTEMKTEPGIPEPPPGYSTEEKRVYMNFANKFNSMGVLTANDGPGLEMITASYLEWQDILKEIKKHGRVYETVNSAKQKMFRPRPEVAMADMAFKRLRSMLQEFGATAKARNYVDVKNEKISDEFDSLLK